MCQALKMNKEDIKVKLLAETVKVGWKEIEKFFARGAVLKVSGELDLLEVATNMAYDESVEIEKLMQAGKLGELSVEQAKEWSVLEDDDLWAVVVSPWVMVQQRS